MKNTNMMLTAAIVASIALPTMAFSAPAAPSADANGIEMDYPHHTAMRNDVDTDGTTTTHSVTTRTRTHHTSKYNNQTPANGDDNQ